MSEWIQALNEASIPFLVWLQTLQTDGIAAFMTFFSMLGAPQFFVLFFPLLYWVISKRLGIYTGISFLTANAIGDLIKWTFQLPRPPQPPVLKLWPETSPGFVSTHASNAVAVWGTLAILIRRWWFTIIALLLIFFIGLSRLFLGVHFPADVIGGWLVGLFAIWLSLWLIPRLTPTLAAWSPLKQIIGAVLVAAALLLIFPGDYDGLRPAGDGVRDAGLILGLLLGLIWDHHKLSFSVDGPWLKRILRYVVGIVLVVAAYFGLDILFETLGTGNYLLEQSLRLVRYITVGFIIPGFGPWLFQRLRLA